MKVNSHDKQIELNYVDEHRIFRSCSKTVCAFFARLENLFDEFLTAKQRIFKSKRGDKLGKGDEILLPF